MLTSLQYACFVEDCDKLCSTPQKRRMHLTDKHMFPKDYDFFVVNNGIDHKSSMLRSGRHRRKGSVTQHMTESDDRTRRRNSTRTSKGQEVTQNESADSTSPVEAGVLTPITPDADSEMDGLAGAMSSLKFIPPSVRFGRGRGKGRGGFSRT